MKRALVLIGLFLFGTAMLGGAMVPRFVMPPATAM